MQRLEGMITAVDQKVLNVAASVDATSGAIKTNQDTVTDLARAVERIRMDTAAKLGVSGRITTI